MERQRAGGHEQLYCELLRPTVLVKMHFFYLSNDAIDTLHERKEVVPSRDFHVRWHVNLTRSIYQTSPHNTTPHLCLRLAPLLWHKPTATLRHSLMIDQRTPHDLLHTRLHHLSRPVSRQNSAQLRHFLAHLFSSISPVLRHRDPSRVGHHG